MAVAARKMIERSKKSGKIRSTDPVRFDRSYLYFLESHRGRKYASAVKKLLPQKPAFHRVFKDTPCQQGLDYSWTDREGIGLPADWRYVKGGRTSNARHDN